MAVRGEETRRRLILGLLGVMVLGAGEVSAQPGQGAVPEEVGLLTNPSRTPSTPPTREGRWQQDLAFLKTELPRLHVNAFHALSRQKWEGMVDALAARAGTLTDEQMTVGVMELVVAIGDGHTRVDAGLPVYPLQLRWFGEELRVVAAKGIARPALGLRVLEVGGLPLEEAVRRALAVVSHDSEWDGRAGAQDALLRPDVQQFLGLKAGEFAFARPSGDRLTLKLQPQTPTQAQSDWRVVEAPLTLAESHGVEPYWLDYPDNHTIYLRYLSCDDAPAFAQVARVLLAKMDAMKAGTRRVVVDLRGNGGGDSSVMGPLLDGLKARGFGAGGKGKIAVLMDRYTYSSALMNAVQLKVLGARLYGEPPGENLTSYGQVQSLTLPNSGLQIRYSTDLFRNAPNLGAPQLGDGLLQPDVPVTLTYADYLKGVDPVLEAALK